MSQWLKYGIEESPPALCGIGSIKCILHNLKEKYNHTLKKNNCKVKHIQSNDVQQNV